MENIHAALIIAVAAAVTALTRFLPFAVFGEKRETPKYIIWLGSVLPYAIMGMLVVYCFKGVNVLSAPYGIPELIATIIVVALTAWKRKSLLSIGGGTICYMMLVQFIFN